MNDCIVIIPTYNEIESIIRSGFFSINPFIFLLLMIIHLITLLIRLFYFNLNLLEIVFRKEPKKSGLGTAYVHGFKWALAHKYDFILKWMPTLTIK
jgi:dolichol-phosphate mannosyltransferase